MILTLEENGMYNSSILLMNKEVEGLHPIDITKMGINLTRLDILIDEIKTIREDICDQNEVYKMIERAEDGNLMRNGRNWRARGMMVMKEVFYRVMQAKKVTEMYRTHQRVIENFIKENRWTEEQELVGVGWVETTKEFTCIKTKMTKRQGHNFDLRLEIFETKRKICQRYKKESETG